MSKIVKNDFTNHARNDERILEGITTPPKRFDFY